MTHLAQWYVLRRDCWYYGHPNFTDEDMSQLKS